MESTLPTRSALVPTTQPVGGVELDLMERTNALVKAFTHIGNTRMEGIPILNLKLVVEAVGFESYTDTDGCKAALGILITPWFMNLIWLPLQGQVATPGGTVRERRFGGDCFEFIGADESSFGTYEMCSLFSPVFEFEDQLAATATASEVLIVLRTKPAEPPPPPKVEAPSRRAFLTGHVASRAGEQR